MKILTFTEFLIRENSGDVYKPVRGKLVVFNPKMHPELADEFFNLISIAYAEIGGHTKVKSPSDVFSDPDWNFWEGIDIHGSEDFDIIMFGTKTRYGIKFTGVGHDGTTDAKKRYLDERGKDLKDLGYYVETSGKVAEILINKYKVPVVENKEEVMKVLGKPIEWTGHNSENSSAPGEGWYKRMIGGKPHEKIMLGRPKV